MTFKEFKDMIEDRAAIEKQETLADLRRLHNENGAQYGGDGPWNNYGGDYEDEENEIPFP